MKKYLVIIAILLSNLSYTYSCGYAPHGEDVRYSLFLPEYFNYKDFSSFYFNADLFGFDYYYQNQYESNVEDWYNFTKKSVPIDDVNECLNSMKQTDINSNSSNKFVQYLYKNNLNDVIKYLITAKKCEEVNSTEDSNSWEREEKSSFDTQHFIEQLNHSIEAEKSSYLKRKYAFLTIRTAYYQKRIDLIKNLFDKYFAHGEKDYLYYWALYFNSFQNKNASVDIANVMANSVEKKYACYYFFHEQFDLEKALALAKSPSDIANIYAYASVQRLQPNLDYLKKIYENSNNSRILDFLLLREINKIEDRIYTPYYTNYLPSIPPQYINGSDYKSFDKETTETLRLGSEKERLYAKQVLNFINTIDFSKIKDVSLWKAAKIQLLFMTRDYAECLRNITEFEKKYSKEKVLSQIEKIKALCFISNQPVGKATIKDEVKPIILKYLNDEHFIFSLGRELEFRNNITDGLALISCTNSNRSYDYFNYSIEWQGNRLANAGLLKYFIEYFDYLDFVYDANNLQIIVNKISNNINDPFYKTIYRNLINDKNYLKDLLGTKYIRENRLAEAEKSYKSIDQKYWDENYNSWERSRLDENYLFDENPFYDLKYTLSFIPHEEKYIVNKLSVIQHLNKYIEIANNPNTKDRDYYYFIIGNCYLNMTTIGNSWMMRRFSSIYYDYESKDESYIDEREYLRGGIAQKYYHLAYENAKTDQFKALCLKMVDYVKNNCMDSKSNLLKTSYPKYFDDLSNCENLSDFFKHSR